MRIQSAALKSLMMLPALLLGVSSSELQASPLTQPGKDAAQIVGSPGYSIKNLYRVGFVEIDGERLVGARDEMWLEPGRYTLTVDMFIENPPGGRHTLMRSNLRDTSGYNKIELVVEAGKRYHVLAKYDREREGVPFRTVLHQVESMGD
jgi:hypothetical protein